MSPRMKYRLARMVITSGTKTPRSSQGTIDTLLNEGVRILTAEGPEPALGDDVVPHLAEGVLGVDPGLAGGDLDDAGHLGLDRSGGQAVEELLDDPGRFADLLQADPVTGEGITVGMGPDLPVELLPGQRRHLVAAQVEVDARGPGVGPRQAVIQGDVPRDDPDAPGAPLEDLVAHEQRLDLVAEPPGLLHDPSGLVDPALGQVLLDASDAVVVGVETPAGGPLDQVEDVLAVPEGEEDRGQGARAGRPCRRGRG